MLKKEDIPNMLTYVRLAAVPAFVAAFVLGWQVIAVWLFMIAAWTDFFDGYLARKWNVETKFGAMLDQISDKLLVSASLICLVSTGQLAVVAVVILIFREILVSGLREYMGNSGVAMPVSKLGKWKTAAQLLGITAVLLAPVADADWMIIFGTSLVWIAAVLAAVSGWQYTKFVFNHQGKD